MRFCSLSPLRKFINLFFLYKIFAEAGNQIFDKGEDLFAQFAQSLARIAQGIQRGGNAFLGSLMQGLDRAHREKVDTFNDAIRGEVVRTSE